jgi:CheY-like chemotaxis protein/curved DNA-binding protein CbpA
MTAAVDSRRTDKWSTDLARLLERAELSETHYEVLGIEATADSSEISEAYGRIIEVLQPARETLQPSSGEELDEEVAAIRKNMAARVDASFGRVTLAFAVLSDSQKRTEYDEMLKAQLGDTGRLEGKLPETCDSDAKKKSPNEDNRRSRRRFNLYIAAQVTGYSRDGARWEEPAETLDVSKTGLTFRIRKALQTGQILYISLPLPTKLRMHGFDDPNYEVYAVVRRIEPAKKGVRVVGVELIGDQPPAAYLEKPWATFHDKNWDGAERRRKPRQPKEEVIWIEYFTELMQSVRREAARTENVSEGGMRIKVKSAPGDFEYIRISYTDARPQAFATVCDSFVGEDNFERLCVRFLQNNELAMRMDALIASDAVGEADGDAEVIALGPPGADTHTPPAVPHSAAIHAFEISERPAKVEMLRGPNFKRRRILIADDDAPLRTTLGKILHTAGYEVTLVEDGKAAVAKAASEHPDLIITDALMPKLHGFLVCKTVKGFNPPPKVIMLTAVYTKPAYKWEARDKYGADDLLTKPFKVPELLAAIEKQLSVMAVAEPVSA